MPLNSRFTLEICVENAAGLAACAGLADRIELCSALDVGGVTPSAGLMQAAKASGEETHVLIRPRTGDFALAGDDLAVALADIEHVRTLGLAGVVVGAVRGEGLDLEALDRMRDAAGDMKVTLHRAFDVVSNQTDALEQVIALGFDRILTSGGAKTAPEGAAQLALLRTQAAGRIEIMAGAGIRPDTLESLVHKTGLTSYHASATQVAPIEGTFADMGFGVHNRCVSRSDVARLREGLEAAVEQA